MLSELMNAGFLTRKFAIKISRSETYVFIAAIFAKLLWLSYSVSLATIILQNIQVAGSKTEGSK